MHKGSVMKRWARFLVPMFLIVCGIFVSAQSVLGYYETDTFAPDGTKTTKDIFSDGRTVTTVTSPTGEVTATASTPAASNPDDSGVFDYVTQTILGIITKVLTTIVGGIGMLILVVIEMLVIPILNYNSFSTSTIIGLGWSLVRDVVNMFVIIVLLAIAIRTILGLHGSNWQQQIPQLFIAVVMVNFSRTICGLAIDVSQVIMFTFVNALLDIAAGNFAQLFQLTSFGKFDPERVRLLGNSGESVSNMVANLTGAFLQIPLYGSILAIMFLLAGAFLWRIVILWILVILSPLAFFLQGIKGILPVEGAGDWMGKFTGALVMGPLLTFFLWLALAAASSGSISQSEGFPLPVNSAATGLSLEVFDSNHLTSIILALILLIVGMQQAGQYSARLDGLAKSLINEDMGRKVVSLSARAPFIGASAAARGAYSAGSYVGSAAGRGIDRYGVGVADMALGQKGSLNVREAFGKKGISIGKSMAEAGAEQKGILGNLRFAAGRAVIGAAGTLETAGEHFAVEDLKVAQDQVKGMGDDQKVAQFELIARGQESWKKGTKNQFDVLAAELVTSTKAQKKTKDHIEDHHFDGGVKTHMAAGMSKDDAEKLARKEAGEHATAQMDKIMQNAIASVDAKKNFLLDDAGKNKLNEAKSKYLHLLRDENGQNAEKAIRKFVKSNDFNASKLSDEAVRDGVVQTVLGDEQDRNVKEKMTYLDRIEMGKYQARMPEGYRSQASARKYQELVTGTASQADFDKAFKEKTVRGENINVADITNPAVGERIVMSVLNENNGVDTASLNPQVRTAVSTEVMRRQDSGLIASAIDKNIVDVTTLQPADVDFGTSRGRATAQAVFESNADVTRIANPAVQTALRDGVTQMYSAGQINMQTAAKAHEKFLNAGNTIEQVIPGVVLDPAAQDFAGYEPEVAEIIRSNVANARHLDRAVPTVKNAAGAYNPSNGATRIVARTATADGIDDLAKNIRGTKNPAKKAELKNSLEVIVRALQVEEANTPPPLPGAPVNAAQKQREKLAELSAHAIAVNGLV